MTEVPRWDEATQDLSDSQAAEQAPAAEPTPPGWQDDRLPVAALEHIDQVCLAFEDAWLAGQPLRIETCCPGASEPERRMTALPLLRHRAAASTVTLGRDS